MIERLIALETNINSNKMYECGWETFWHSFASGRGTLLCSAPPGFGSFMWNKCRRKRNVLSRAPWQRVGLTEQEDEV